MNEQVKIEQWGGDLMKELSIYCNNRIAVFKNTKKLKAEYPVKTDAFLITLCLKGEASLLIDGQAYVIRRNDLLVYHPNLILERCAESPDFENLTLMLSPDYVKQMPILSGGGWDVWLFLEKNPIIPLRQEEADLYCQYHDLLYSRLTALHRGRYHKELIDALLSAFLFEFHDVLERFISVKPQTFTSSEKLFKTFIETLASTYPKSRSVAYYASRIHVSAKYLSAVCKEVSHHAASDIINHYAIKDIEYQLKRTQKSIKEIACELDFPNLSFFGKYVKRHLKMSPREYREQCAHLTEEEKE